MPGTHQVGRNVVCPVAGIVAADTPMEIFANQLFALACDDLQIQIVMIVCCLLNGSAVPEPDLSSAARRHPKSGCPCFSDPN